MRLLTLVWAMGLVPCILSAAEDARYRWGGRADASWTLRGVYSVSDDTEKGRYVISCVGGCADVTRTIAYSRDTGTPVDVPWIGDGESAAREGGRGEGLCAGDHPMFGSVDEWILKYGKCDQ